MDAYLASMGYGPAEFEEGAAETEVALAPGTPPEPRTRATAPHTPPIDGSESWLGVYANLHSATTPTRARDAVSASSRTSSRAPSPSEGAAETLVNDYAPVGAGRLDTLSPTPTATYERAALVTPVRHATGGDDDAGSACSSLRSLTRSARRASAELPPATSPAKPTCALLVEQRRPLAAPSARDVRPHADVEPRASAEEPRAVGSAKGVGVERHEPLALIPEAPSLDLAQLLEAACRAPSLPLAPTARKFTQVEERKKRALELVDRVRKREGRFFSHAEVDAAQRMVEECNRALEALKGRGLDEDVLEACMKAQAVNERADYVSALVRDGLLPQESPLFQLLVDSQSSLRVSAIKAIAECGVRYWTS